MILFSNRMIRSSKVHSGLLSVMRLCSCRYEGRRLCWPAAATSSKPSACLWHAPHCLRVLLRWPVSPPRSVIFWKLPVIVSPHQIFHFMMLASSFLISTRQTSSIPKLVPRYPASATCIPRRARGATGGRSVDALTLATLRLDLPTAKERKKWRKKRTSKHSTVDFLTSPGIYWSITLLLLLLKRCPSNLNPWKSQSSRRGTWISMP